VSFHVAGSRKTRLFSKVSMLAAIAAGLLLLAGCGSSSSSSSSAETTVPAATPTTSSATTSSTPAASGGEKLSIAADSGGQLKYDKTSLTAKAGKVSIDFSNASPVGHNVTVESSSGASVGETPTFVGGSRSVSLNLKPGKYKFYCSVPGHRQAGMEGTLTVN
jgi:plastocyanin